MVEERKDYLVYYLHDSSDIPRYIGKTSKRNLPNRFTSHIGHAKNLEKCLKTGEKFKEGNLHKSRWILKNNYNVQIKPLLEGLTEDEALEKEIYFIEYYNSLGHNLTNFTNGGEGRSREHVRCDDKIHHLYNQKTKEEFKGTKLDFCEKYGFKTESVNPFFAKKQKFIHKQWVFHEDKELSFNEYMHSCKPYESTQKTVHLYNQNTKEEYVGSIYHFLNYIGIKNDGRVKKLVEGKMYYVNDWCLYENRDVDFKEVMRLKRIEASIGKDYSGGKPPYYSGINHPCYGKKLKKEHIEKLSLAKRGEKHFKADKRLYRFFNTKSGLEFIGTRIQFANEHKIKSNRISEVINKKRPHAGYWVCDFDYQAPDTL